MFPKLDPILKNTEVYFSTEEIENLKKIKDQIRSRSTLSVLKKILLNNQTIDKTWFLLNKQAAFAGVVVIVEEEDESPLGPIKITIKNLNIDEIFRWFEN